jgi:glutamate mutase epsilon subunit
MNRNAGLALSEYTPQISRSPLHCQINNAKAVDNRTAMILENGDPVQVNQEPYQKLDELMICPSIEKGYALLVKCQGGTQVSHPDPFEERKGI